MIRTRESALCKLRKKYRAKKLKEVCQLDSNPLIQSLSSSLNEDTSTFLASIVRNSKHVPKGRRWSYKEKVLAVSILKHSPRSYTFLRSLFPLPSRSLQSLLNAVQFGTGIKQLHPSPHHRTTQGLFSIQVKSWHISVCFKKQITGRISHEAGFSIFLNIINTTRCVKPFECLQIVCALPQNQ